MTIVSDLKELGSLRREKGRRIMAQFCKKCGSENTLPGPLLGNKRWCQACRQWYTS